MSLDHWDKPDGSYTTVIPPGVSAIRKGVDAHFGISRSEVIRDKSRCDSKASEHCECGAIDFFPPNKDVVVGRRIFDWCVANADVLGIQSVIFNGRQIGFGNPKERERTTDRHEDHVHVGISRAARTTVSPAMVAECLGRPAPGPTRVTTPPPSGQLALTSPVPGFKTAADAAARRGSNSTVAAGNYAVFNRALDMVNVTRRPGTPGAWINPGDLTGQPEAIPPIDFAAIDRHFAAMRYPGAPLAAGATGDAVNAVQWKLNTVAGCAFNCDGQYTVDVETKVRDFQKFCQVQDERDGRVGPNTWVGLGLAP